MPLIFRKVYGDVNGKREVVRTIKISGRAAKKYSEMRERQREQRKEERTIYKRFDIRSRMDYIFSQKLV